MKKLFLLIAVVAMILPSCGKINDAIDELDNRLDKLEQETIPSVDEQIAAINMSLDNLNAMDIELKGYIDDLTTTATNLQEQINTTNTKIDEVKSELKNDISSTEEELNGEIATAKADVLAQLEALEAELKTELAQINATIELLQSKDAELDGKITELRTYVDTELGNTTDWVAATFATLEQYNALASEVATIKEQIKAINESITNLETKLTTKINEDIATAVSTLNADIQQKVKEITEAYTAAVKTAKEEIAAAYTAAIQTAINALDASLKAWVGEQLANYYTIAEVEAKIAALQVAITEGDATLQEELKSLKSQLETTATEITSAYKKAIEEAINTNNGVIDTKIANEIAAINQRISNEVATINAKIAEIESRLDNVEAKIAELLARIQSVSYIPTYDDGKATVKYNGGASQVVLDFKISPKECVVELEKVWKEVLKVEAVYTQTRAVSFVELQVVKCEVDTTTGVLSIVASCSNLSAEFFAGTQEASAALVISDGNNSVTSEYVPMTSKEVSDEELEEDILSSIPKNQIWYTTEDNSKLFPNTTDVTTFGAVLTSNVYKNGKGILTFDDEVTKIGDEAFKDCSLLTSVTIGNSVTSIGEKAFYNCKSLTSITIPDSVTTIGSHAFYECRSLTSVTIPDSATSIGKYTFYYCRSLTSVTIPDSVTSIGDYAFKDCNSLTSVYYNGDLSDWCNINFYSSASNPLNYGAKLYINNTEVTEITIPSDISKIKNYTFRGCSSLTSVTIPDSVTSIGSSAFSSCSSLTSITIPDSVTSIGDYAFSGCSSLTSITIPDSVTSIGSNAFSGCSSLTSITIPESVTSIGDFAFSRCSSLTSITIPDSVTTIGSHAFYECSSLTSVTIPVTSIGSYAFHNCDSLTSVIIGKNVAKISIAAFTACDNLQYIYCRALTPPEIECDDDHYGPFNQGIIIYIPAKSYATYYQYAYAEPNRLAQSNWYIYKSYLVPYNFEE